MREAVERSRIEFEQWVITPSPGLNDPEGFGGLRLQLEKDGRGHYLWPETQKLWMAWQAARRSR